MLLKTEMLFFSDLMYKSLKFLKRGCKKPLFVFCKFTQWILILKVLLNFFQTVRIFATQKRLRRTVSSGSLTAAFIFAVPYCQGLG